MPDIDLDFPRDIREKLIVSVCERYGREHSALVAASRPTTRAGRSATSARRSASLSRSSSGWRGVTDGWNPTASRRSSRSCPTPSERCLAALAAFARLCGELGGLPRHVSQHPGGMVISTRPLVELVPVQPAAMAGRQMCQWDKDSCADAGFLKIDLLGLGMLSAVEDCVEQVARAARQDDRPLQDPLEDRAVYAEIRRRHRRRLPDREPCADAVASADPAREPRRPDRAGGARAPGPIQGGAVHPYVENRQSCARTRTSFLRTTSAARAALQETLGVVVFQEQVLGVAIALAGFSRGRGRGAAPRHEPQAQQGSGGGVPRALRRGALQRGVDRDTANTSSPS